MYNVCQNITSLINYDLGLEHVISLIDWDQTGDSQTNPTKMKTHTSLRIVYCSSFPIRVMTGEGAVTTCCTWGRMWATAVQAKLSFLQTLDLKQFWTIIDKLG